jgi:transposase
MGRPPVIPAEQKTRAVLSVFAGEMSIAEAGPWTREQQLEAEVADLTRAGGRSRGRARTQR